MRTELEKYCQILRGFGKNNVKSAMVCVLAAANRLHNTQEVT